MNKMINNNFGIIDFTILFLMLGISLAIGLYFGCGKKKQTTDAYLMGNRKMKIIPIGISLIASQLSAFTIIALPADIYAFSPHIFLTFIPIAFVMISANWIIMPVFYNNKIDNCYKYVEMRFGNEVKWMLTICFLLSNFLILPIFLYLPALALSQAIDCSPHIINIISCGFCVLYTMLGGIKAVVWTDVVQGIIMILTMIVTFSIGIFEVGGINEVWNRNLEGNRLKFNFSLDLTIRQTFLNTTTGGTIAWITYICFNQSCVQRMVSLPSIKHARRAVILFGIGTIITLFFICSMGLIMYAYYYECDPIKANLVKSVDKMVPYFIQQITGHLNGMSGLFIACLFSASLSTISAILNSMAGVIYTDLVKPIKSLKNFTKNSNVIMKMTIVLIGIYAVSMGFVVNNFNSILQMFFTFLGLTSGTIFGVFTLGMLYPWANKKPILIASAITMTVMIWLCYGAYTLTAKGEIQYSKLPMSTLGCSNVFNVTIIKNFTEILDTKNVIPTNDDFSIYKISFQWYSFIGAILMWLIGIPLSHLIGTEEIKKLNPNLISPIAQCLIPAYVQRIELRRVKRNIIDVVATDEENGPFIN